MLRQALTEGPATSAPERLVREWCRELEDTFGAY
ncbi:hypothetical protein RKD23_001892 [Streptomyces sp. SAI-170]